MRPVRSKSRRTSASLCASFGPCATVCTFGFTCSPGRNAVVTRSSKSKLMYQASRSSVTCERCMWVPFAKYSVPRRSASPSVSKFAILPGPSPARCVEVKPRKSSDVSGIRSAPGTPALIAICLGNEEPPSNPPPAKPRRRLLHSSSDASRRPGRGSAPQPRDLEQRRFPQAGEGVVDVVADVAAEEDGDVVLLEDGLVGVAREPPRLEQHGLLGAEVVREGAVRLVGDEALEVRQPPRDGDAEPCRRRRVVVLEPAEDVLQRPLRLEERSRVGRHARGDDLVVQRRHEYLDAVVVHDPDAFEQVLLRQEAAGGPRRAAAGEVVDELVDARCPERRRSAAREKSATGQLHHGVVVRSSATARSARASGARASGTAAA